MRRILFALLLVASGSSGAAQAQEVPHIAGLTPSQRPAWAPVIEALSRDGQWYARALHGVEAPYPASLRFLEDQGDWFTPFLHPGMTGPYDLRQWHPVPGRRSE